MSAPECPAHALTAALTLILESGPVAEDPRTTFWEQNRLNLGASIGHDRGADPQTGVHIRYKSKAALIALSRQPFGQGIIRKLNPFLLYRGRQAKS